MKTLRGRLTSWWPGCPGYRPAGGTPALAVLVAALFTSSCGDQPTAPPEAADPDRASAMSDGLDISAWSDFELEGTLRPAFLAAAIADPNRMLDLMASAHEGGTSGFYLRELGGPVLLAENESFVFEPASTIKALVHFHAMRQVQDGAVINGNVMALGTQVQNAWATPPNSSCPQPVAAFSATLQTGLTAMMVPSDNPWTQALRDLFGDPAIDATRQAFNMGSSLLQHRIGCGGDALANPNRLTLVDAGRMYEAVATGYLTGPTRDAAWAIMLTDAGLFNTMIDEESAGLGLSADAVNNFKAARRSALKAGSYGLSSLQYRSVAGWAELGFKDATCAADPREYVYGAFIHAADILTGPGIRALGVETFREQVREGVESWADCEADLRVFSPQVIGLGAPLDVNDVIPFTVRHTVRNDGPAASIDAIIVTTITGPADCILPTADPTTVSALGAAPVTVDIEVTLTCSNPSNHVFQVHAEIEAVNPLVVDPDITNNSQTTFVSRAFIAYADLAVTGWDFTELDGAGLGDFMIGETFMFGTTKTVHNFGDTHQNLYPDPADAVITRTFVVPEGVSGVVRIGADEAPAQVVVQRQGQPDEIHNGVAAGSTITAGGGATMVVSFQSHALAVGQSRQLVEEFGIECAAPGEHNLLFRNEISALDEHLLDHVPDNNAVEVARTIECAVPVAVNIRPGNQHNPVTPASQQQVPVAILTTDAGEYGLPLAFDATTVDAGTARFGTMPVLGAGGGSMALQSFIRDSFELDDKTRDGDLDMVLLLGIVGTGAGVQEPQLCVTGKFLGEDSVWYTFVGCDAYAPKGPGGP